MHYFTFAEKDTTLYEVSGSMNAGLDEVLEVRKDVSDTGDSINVSRIVIKFDLTEISQSIVDGTLGGSVPRYYLNLYDARPTALATSQSLYAYPVSQSWDNGFGREDSFTIIADGASYNFRDNNDVKTMWPGSMTGSGGTWYNQYDSSQSFTNQAADVRMDVSNIVWNWLHGVIPNDGFMVKRSGSIGNLDSTLDEGTSKALGNFSFFSRETHNIYQPKVEVVWDHSKWSTGSLEYLTSTELEDVKLYPRSLRDQYKEDSKVKFRVAGRPLYPEKTFSATAGYSTGCNTAKMLPSGSTFYQVVDVFTDDIIIPYGS